MSGCWKHLFDCRFKQNIFCLVGFGINRQSDLGEDGVATFQHVRCPLVCESPVFFVNNKLHKWHQKLKQLFFEGGPLLILRQTTRDREEKNQRHAHKERESNFERDLMEFVAKIRTDFPKRRLFKHRFRVSNFEQGLNQPNGRKADLWHLLRSSKSQREATTIIGSELREYFFRVIHPQLLEPGNVGPQGERKVREETDQILFAFPFTSERLLAIELVA